MDGFTFYTYSFTRKQTLTRCTLFTSLFFTLTFKINFRFSLKASDFHILPHYISKKCGAHCTYTNTDTDTHTHRQHTFNYNLRN